MQRYEQMRNDRLEEHKKKDKGGGSGGEEENDGGEVHRSTTVFHAGGEGKGWLDPPSYMRQKEHACFIPKKFLHTYAGHDKGV